MHDFKVGDRVEYVGNVSSAMLGKVGVVVEPPFANSGMVYFDHGGAESYGAYSQSLRHVTTAPDVITIDRADLPEVSERDGWFWAGSGPEECRARGTENPNWLRNHANAALALADFIEAREKAAEEAKAVEKEAAALLSKRRNDLAKEVAKKAGWNDWEHASYYSHQSEAQAAIDMMIAAEDDRG